MNTPSWVSSGPARTSIVVTIAALVLATGALVSPATAAPQVIYVSAVGKQNPDLALSANGDAVAVWAQGNTSLMVSVRPSGGFWSAPQLLGTTDRGNPNPHVVIDSTGFATVVWTSTASGNHYLSVATRPAAGTWSAVTDLDPGTYGENPDIDIDAAGTVTAAWQSPSAFMRVSSHPIGSATWTTPVEVGFGYAPTLAHGATHHALMWASNGTIVGRVITNGGDWTTATTEVASLTDIVGYEPEIAFGPGDVLEAVWAEGVTVPADPDPITTETVHTAKRSAAGVWANTGESLSDPGVTNRPSGIAIDSAGDMTFVYGTYDGTASQKLHSRTRHDGTWEAIQTLSSTYQQDTARMVVDSDDLFTVAWGDDPAKTASRNSTTTWGTPTPLSTTGLAFGAAVQLDGDGHALVVWTRQYSDGTGFHSAVEATIFTPVLSDTTPPTTTLKALPTYVLGSSVPLGWTATDAQSLVTGTDVRYRSAAWNGGFGVLKPLVTNSAAHAASAAVAPGATYCYSARSRDSVPNVSGWTAERCAAAPADDKVASRSPGWVRKSSALFYRGSALVTKKKNATLKLTGVRARRIALVVSTGPGNGKVAVFWRGVKVGSWSLASTRAVNRRLITVRNLSGVQTGTLVVKVVTKKKTVRIDGFAISQR